MATYIRIFPSAFTGLGFNGAMFVGVGFTVAPADTVSVTDVATVSKSLHVGPHDSVLVTDSAVITSAIHIGGYGPGVAFIGLGTLGYAFTGVGQAGTYLIMTVSDRVTVTDTVASTAVLL